MQKPILLGVDTGGTFTDFVLHDNDGLHIHKVLSTPAAPEQAILQGIAELAIDPQQLILIHGSTVATNAVLEGKGVNTAYITNRGMKDTLTIGRQARKALYQLQPAPQTPPVPESLCFELNVRSDAQGNCLQPIDPQQLDQLVAQLVAKKPQSVAINLLFSYLDDTAEKQIAAALPESLFISLSSEVLPEIKEYERGIATWLNGWVGPIVKGYLQRLSDQLSCRHIAVMQSSAATIALAKASDHSVRLLLSGPAGGIKAAHYIGQQTGLDRQITFDMGGTSTDVSLIAGPITLTNEGEVAGYPVAVPMVDIHTIGAGGGSIARIDAGGLLQVGPESAGASPGPACYDRGGTEPTVTDANLVLNRIPLDTQFAGNMKLNKQRSITALMPLAHAMACTLEEAAMGIIELANEHMAAALRVISVQRGYDPQTFTLSSFGGSGGLHVCALAEALEMEQAIIPLHSGVLSALGMLVTEPGREFSQTINQPLAEIDEQWLETKLNHLADKGTVELLDEGIKRSQLDIQFYVDLCYRGQSYTLTIPWLGSAHSITQFHQQHQQRYGHLLDLPLQLLTIRVSLRSQQKRLNIATTTPTDPAKPIATDSGTPVLTRAQLTPGLVINGPCLITETIATHYVSTGWQVQCDHYGHLLLNRHHTDYPTAA